MSAFASVDDVKSYLGLSTDADDVLIASLVLSEAAFIESWTNRTFSVTSQMDIFSGGGGQEHAFKFFPVISVTSLSVSGLSIPAAPTINDSGYMVFDDRLLLFGYNFGWGNRSCIVQYSAGYSVIPFEIKQACIEMVAIRYKERDRVGLNSKSMAGETTAYNVKDMPDHVKSILKQYKRVVPI